MKSSSSFSNQVSRLIRRVCFALVIGGAAQSASADVVTDWNATLEAALRNPTASPFVVAHTAAIVHVAIYDAVNGIVKNYQPLRVAAAAPAGAMPEAAAIQAAYTTLATLLPTKRAAFDTQLAASLAKISGNPPTRRRSPSAGLGASPWPKKFSPGVPLTDFPPRPRTLAVAPPANGATRPTRPLPLPV